MTDPQSPAPGRPHDSAPSDALALLMTAHWADGPDSAAVRHPATEEAAARRERLSSAFLGQTLVVPTGRPKPRSGDTDHDFRPGSDYVYLVGAKDPHHVLVMHPDGPGHRAVVYMPPRADRASGSFYTDAARGELWIGPQKGLDDVAWAYGVETAPLDALPGALQDEPRPRVHVGLDPAVEDLAAAEHDGALAAALAAMRLVKDPYEIAQIEDAVAATVRGFEDVRFEIRRAKSVRRGERWLEGTFWRRARADGNDVGYSAIVAGGDHATTLHWQPKDGPVADGDLLLLDMGVETDELYTADVTRTVPVSGRFTPEQRRVYDAVLAAQDAALGAVRAGAPFLAPHRAAMRVCAEFLVGAGLLEGDVGRILDEQLHRRWTLHGTSHHLGLDVHDCIHADTALYREGVLREGMIITVEPGLYFQRDDLLVPADLRGIGVRIEDDVLVTAVGFQNLSGALPRAADDVEAWMAERDRP